MKTTGQCPKCGSRDIIADAMAIDRGDDNVVRDLAVATSENPRALLFKGKRETSVSAWVCASCGLVEFYADSPEAIRR